jgi:hypothetical protein
MNDIEDYEREADAELYLEQQRDIDAENKEAIWQEHYQSRKTREIKL